MFTRVIIFASAISASAPAAAKVGAQVPEGSHLTLFALGVLGVIVGRQLSRRKQD